MEYILYAVAGAMLGGLCHMAGGALERELGKKRGLTEDGKPYERPVLLAAVICGACIMLFKPSPVMACYEFLLLILAEVSAVMDIRYRIIPNEIIVALLLVKILLIVLSLFRVNGTAGADILSSVIGFAACFAIFLIPAFFGKSVGSGDIKLAAAMGFCLGFKGAFLAVAIMGGLVLVYTLLKSRVPVMAAIRRTVPMGPFLSAGLVAVCIMTGCGLI